ncbi:hypothetical protein [Massilia oculi]|uniref:hypothetical protein n=1 Tax=Massilia oculi TaxID=945844 RepID=UPI001AAE23D9|nr:hypothetical protein [Massilia oculi]
MASISFPPLPPAPATPLQVGVVAAAAPAALLANSGNAPALPFSTPLAATTGAPPQAAADGAAEGAAMRPDQVLMARHLAYPQQDALSLARAWRTQVRNHGSQLTSRALAASAGQLSPAQLMAAQQGQVARQPELLAHQDAWRFTVHAGGTAAQHLEVMAEEADKPPGRRRRPRAALRLELQLADGSVVVIQVEPLPQGVSIEICAPDARALTRLRWLQPELETVLDKAGVKVLRWQYRDRLPAGASHAMIANAEAAAQALTPAVFRTVAELALLLPAQSAPEPRES